MSKESGISNKESIVGLVIFVSIVAITTVMLIIL